MPPRWSGILQPELLARSAHKICEITQFPSPLHFELGTPIQPAYCTPDAHKGADQYLVGQPSPVLATLPIISPAVLMPQARAYPDFDSTFKRFAAASEKTSTASPDLGTKMPPQITERIEIDAGVPASPQDTLGVRDIHFSAISNFHKFNELARVGLRTLRYRQRPQPGAHHHSKSTSYFSSRLSQLIRKVWT